jgi:tetratricopeptide (TPR) repeat protein
MLKRIVLLAAAAALFSLPRAGLAQTQFDQIYLAKSPTPNRGTITGMTKDEVTLDMAGAARTFSTGEIARILYSDENSELSNARTAILQKNYNAALTELKKLNPASLDREYIKQDVLFYTALCQARLAMSEGGDRKAAEKAMLDFVRGATNNWHFYEAAQTLGELAASSGDCASAIRYYTPLTKAPSEETQLKANNNIGRAMIAQKQYPEANQRFDVVLASGLNTPDATEQKAFAQIGKAQCLGESGKVDEAVQAINDIIAKNDPKDAALFARAYNALGNSYLKAGKTKEALQAFLHTDILFYADDAAHAEALYHLSKLWEAVNKQDRAVAARNMLRERYAGSVWNAMN